MNKSPGNRQSGYVLLLTLLAFMGIGGAVIAGYTQGAKKDADQHNYLRNQRVLEEAKQALLMYAYNYPEIAMAFNGTDRGPGRLPCPDFDNTGTPNSINNCFNAGLAAVGRFPWRANGMDFYDARDVSGERLWYAVSQDLNHFDAADVINSDSVGTITIHDQTGALIYDGSIAGVAAVIIAPGPAIDRNGVLQDRSIANADDPEDIVADTDPGIINPVNYLDLFGALDNTDFINNNAGDGFVLGLIDDLAAEELIVNDQMIVITADEVIAMAEKATLQAYRDAIDQYQVNIGVGRYPWLDPYDSADGLTTFDAAVTPAAPSPVIGRLPSIFANYFDPANLVDSQAINPELRLSINIDGVIYNMDIPAPGAANTFFRANGDLVSPLNNTDTITRYFWDGYKSGINGPPHPNSPADGIWEVCPLIGALPNEDDCNRTVAGTFEGAAGSPGPSDVWLEVRDVTITFAGGVPIEFAFSDRTATPVEYWQSSIENPDPQNHVYIAAEYDDNPAYISSFTWSEDEEFLNSFGEEPPGNSGTHTYDAVPGDTIKIGLPYYPVLPAWVLDNNWHDMVQVAYSAAVQPGGDGTCNVGIDDCLTLQNSGGVINDKLALLVLSGNEGDVDPLNTALIDGGGGPQFFADDLGDIFEGQNSTLDLIFDSRPANANDIVLLVE